MATTYKVLGQDTPTTYSVTFQDTGDTVTLNSHGLANGTPVSFTVITTTTGISVNTTYYVISSATNTFQLSLTLGGSAVALTTNGSGTMVTIDTLYTVPSSTSSVISTLVVCSQGLSGTFRVAVRPGGATLDPKHYIIFENFVNTNDSLFFTIGITLATTDIISVYASNSSISFNLYGSEIA
jgi:hypothetical protein